MRRTTIAVSFVAALVLTCQPANAEGFLFARHPKVDRRVAEVGIGAAIASTATYFAIREGANHHHGVNWGAWGIATAGCMVLSPMVAAAVVPERQLTSREVAVLEGSCLIPIVGGLLVNAIYDANPQWEARPVKVARKARARR
jgi:MFS family permease